MSVRLRGFAKFCAFGLGAIVIACLLYRLGNNSHYVFHGELAVFLALPGAFALVGLVEAISGAPFQSFSRRWDSLRWWQRGLTGLVIVSLALVGFEAIVVIFG